MPRTGRGGKRTPNRPAPVSGPGALSQRTDGGPGSTRQPVRSGPMPAHGERGMIEDAQRSVALPQEGPLGGGVTMGGGPGAGAGGGMMPGPSMDVFGPPGPAEMDMGQGMGADQPLIPPSPDEEIAILLEIHHTPELLRLLDMRRRDV